MNTITQKQSEDKQLDRLAAQRQYYSDAKKIQLIDAIISIPIVVILSISAVFFPAMLIWSILWAIISTFLGLILFNPLQKKLKLKAATIQQMFDCYVLEMDCDSLNDPPRIDPESIYKSSKKYKTKDPEYLDLINWYPAEIDQLPIHYARLICQRTNCWWDSQLRARYVKGIQITTILLLICVLLIGLINNLTIDKLLLAVAFPLISIFRFGVTQVRDNNQAISNLNSLKKEAENFWEQAIKNKLSPDEVTKLSYKLQNRIYQNRCQNPLIFDWIYKRIRDENEDQMNRGAEDFIDELKSSLNS